MADVAPAILVKVLQSVELCHWYVMLPDPVDGVETEKGTGVSLQQIVCDNAITPGVT